MYKCKDCGEIFEEPHNYREVHNEIEGGYYEEFSECPYCGGSYEETKRCDDCGGDFLDDELIEGRCLDCTKNTFMIEPSTFWKIISKDREYLEWIMYEYNYRTNEKFRQAEDARIARVRAYREAHREHDEFVSLRVSNAVSLARHEAKEEAEREWNKLHKEKTE